MDAGIAWSSAAPHADGELLVRRAPGAMEITFNRPAKYNAFTEGIYVGLEELCAEAADAPDLRAVVLRGAGGRAFAAGNDIATFTSFTSGADGVAYEARIRRVLDAIAALPPVTIAAVDGHCVGGGLAVAATCDLRLATRNAQFGYPIARTLGNVLSAPLVMRCREVFGDPLTREMLLAARLVEASRAYAVGALAEVVDSDELSAATDAIVAGVLASAPLTLRVTKDQLREGDAFELARDEARLAEAYGSEDFREGVRAFLEKETPRFGQRRRA